MAHNNNHLLSSIQKNAEQVLVALFNRMKPLVEDNKLSLTDAIRIGKEVVADIPLMTSLIDYGCTSCLATQDIVDMRLNPFHRMVMQMISAVLNKEKNEKTIDKKVLLQFINVLEVALGKCRFDEAELVCNNIIEKMRVEKGINYKLFFENKEVILEYLILMTNLGEFLNSCPKRRIDWLFNSMSSVSSVSTRQGIPTYSNDTILFISKEDLRYLLLLIFKQVIVMMNKYKLDDSELKTKRLALLNNASEELLTKLIKSIELL